VFFLNNYHWIKSSCKCDELLKLSHKDKILHVWMIYTFFKGFYYYECILCGALNCEIYLRVNWNLIIINHCNIRILKNHMSTLLLMEKSLWNLSIHVIKMINKKERVLTRWTLIKNYKMSINDIDMAPWFPKFLKTKHHWKWT
jgi:hypothetical protein